MLWEVGYGLHKSVGDVGEVALEAAESFACHAGVMGIDGAVGEGFGDEARDAPVAFAVEIIGFAGAVGQRNECENAPVNVVGALGFEFFTKVTCHGLDVALQAFYIGENVVVDALEYIVGAFLAGVCHSIGVVDEAFAEGSDFGGRAFNTETGYYIVEIFH